MVISASYASDRVVNLVHVFFIHTVAENREPGQRRFNLRCPAITVGIINDYGLADIVAERFDAGIRLGEQVAQEMIAVRIGPDFNQFVVGAPSYFDKRGKPKTPYDLAGHQCIVLQLPTSGGTWSWPFVYAGRELKVRPGGQLSFNKITLQLDTVLAGLELGYLPDDVVSDHIADGRLMHVLADWSAPMSGYHLYYPSRRQQTAAFSSLVEALGYRRTRSSARSDKGARV